MSDILKLHGPDRTDAGRITVTAQQHYHAADPGMVHTNDHGRAMSMMLRGWSLYAKAHRDRFESGIGEDYMLGLEWADIGMALLGLLNGETGGLDRGSIDRNVRAEFAAELLSCDDSARQGGAQ